MGVNKEFSDFCDIMLKDCGDFYSIEYMSDKGKSAFQGFKTGDRPRKTGDRPLSYSSGRIRQGSVPCLTRSVPCLRGPCLTKDDADYFDIIDWDKVTQACKGCGICTYICPTCYCFDFRDVSQKGIAKRYKCWDSCMYPKFTLHASGHNPREHRYERYRQRVLHKYKYVPANFDGCVACTGCGRCVRGCPVGINIKEILMQITNYK